MIRRALILALGTVALLAAPAAAQQTYSGLSGSTQVESNGSIHVTGDGCAPNSAITWSATKDGAAFSNGTSSADANGAYDFTVATDGPGQYQVTVTCGDQTAVLDATVTRTPGAPARRRPPPPADWPPPARRAPSG